MEATERGAVKRTTRKLALVLLLVGCGAEVDVMSDTVTNITVYQFANVAVGDTIPGTVFEWTAADARAVMAKVDRTNVHRGTALSSNHGHYNLGNCENPHHGRTADRERCYRDRQEALLRVREQYIRELQLLGVR